MTHAHQVITRFLGIFTAVALGSIAFGSSAAFANEAEFDRYVVHYSVINTTFLSPEVARAYDVRRSANRALINISVMERVEDGRSAISASITGPATNLNNQMRNLRFREIQDGDAIYHLSEVTVRRGEILDFDIEVSPADTDRVLPIRFSREFFAD